MNNNEKNINVYRSCLDLEKGNLFFATHIGCVEKSMSPCCSLSMYNAATELMDNPEESLSRFTEYRHAIIEENQRIYHTDDKERKYTIHCVNCPSYVVDNWEKVRTDNIQYVNLSVSPSPCQAKCIYCNHRHFDHTVTDDSKVAYERLFNLLEYIKEKNNDMGVYSTWQVSSGEIAIHPYKERLIGLVKGLPVAFLSNCFKFEQSIADHLKSSPESYINLSIDSGTATTWKRIKGFNNFNVVLHNLEKYCKHCDQVNHQQIELKYIVMPGINTRIEDYNGIVKIMKKLQVKDLMISRDVRFCYDPLSQEYKDLYDCIVHLASVCKTNGLGYKLAYGGFTQDEIDYVKHCVEQFI